MPETLPVSGGLGLVEEEPTSKLDRWVKYLISAILAVIVLILTVLLYGLVAGVINPPAPRTAEEFVLNRAEAMIAQSPKSAQYWADYIEILSNRGRYSEAEKAVKDARKAVGNDESILLVNNAELILLMSQNKYQEAFTKSDAFLKQDDEFVKKRFDEYRAQGISADPYGSTERVAATVETLNLRASAGVRLKEYDEAIKALTYALTVSPTSADVAVFRGNVYVMKGDDESLEKARDDFQFALQFLPDNQAAQEGLKEVEKLTGKATPPLEKFLNVTGKPIGAEGGTTVETEEADDGK